jgi:THO complex subunit 2
VKKLLVSGVEYMGASITYQLTLLQASGTVNATVCRERLETALVANVGLIADKAAFEKKEIRTRTGLL